MPLLIDLLIFLVDVFSLGAWLSSVQAARVEFIVGSVIGGLTMLATVTLAGIAFRDIPKIRKQLTDKEFVADELAELIKKGAVGPQEPTDLPSPISEPVLLRDVRVGKHYPIFDRITFEFLTGIPSCEITPLSADDLGSYDVQGQWGILIRLSPCVTRFNGGPTDGESALSRSHGFPNFPTILDYRMVEDGGSGCGWAVGCQTKTSYLPGVTTKCGRPRLFVDFYR